jgi:hypothetical protein
VQESKNIKEIGLPRSVWPNKKNAALKINVYFTEIAPILEPNVAKIERHRWQPPMARSTQQPGGPGILAI